MSEKNGKVLRYAKAFGLVAGGIAVILTAGTGYLKGDDAQQDVASLIKQLDKRVLKHEEVINEQTEGLQKLHRRVVFFQAHQEGVRSGELLATIRQLEEQIETLEKKARRPVLRKQQKQLQRLKPKPPPEPKADAPVQQIPIIRHKPFSKGGD